LDIDLLFAAVTQDEWRSISNAGTFSNTSMEEEEYVWCFEGNEAEKVVNHYFEGEEELLLILLDPLRIQSPFKRIKKDGFQIIEIQEGISLDVVIDRIKLKPDKEGHYSINVNHFD
tara:strand:- start:27181 stop:27528 length:348 start_codon:yes stop_codon:yes gene_type:complete